MIDHEPCTAKNELNVIALARWEYYELPAWSPGLHTRFPAAVTTQTIATVLSLWVRDDTDNDMIILLLKQMDLHKRSAKYSSGKI